MVPGATVGPLVAVAAAAATTLMEEVRTQALNFLSFFFSFFLPMRSYRVNVRLGNMY